MLCFFFSQVQQRIFNVIIFGQAQSDHINQLITVTKIFLLNNLQQMGRMKFDHIKRLITLTSDNTKRLQLHL